MKLDKRIIIPAIAVVFILAGALFYTGNDMNTGGASNGVSGGAAADTAGGAENVVFSGRGRKIELSVFADTALLRPLEEIADQYFKAAPNIRIAYTFATTGELQRRIQDGAYCDIFLAASPESMDALENASTGGPPWNPEVKNLLLPNSRIDLLETLMVLVPPDGNPAGIRDFRQLAQLFRQGEITVAVGLPDGSSGLYADRILNYWRLNRDEIASCLTFGVGGGEEARRVADGAADCGILFATDAQAWKLTAVDEAPEEATGRVLFPGAVMADSEHPEAAAAFLSYLREEPAAAYFRKAGFIHLASMPAQIPNALLMENWGEIPAESESDAATAFLPEAETGG